MQSTNSEVRGKPEADPSQCAEKAGIVTLSDDASRPEIVKTCDQISALFFLLASWKT